jgi:hypothetical protein
MPARGVHDVLDHLSGDAGLLQEVPCAVDDGEGVVVRGDGTFFARTEPSLPTSTMSVNVPPMSTPSWKRSPSSRSTVTGRSP